MAKSKGWRGESRRHSMAAKGIKTKNKDVPKTDDSYWKKHPAYQKNQPGENITYHDYYGRKLSNTKETTLYDENGNPRGKTIVGVDKEGDLCVPDGRIYDAKKTISGQILLIYQTPHGYKSIKVDDNSKPQKPKKPKIKKPDKPDKPPKPINKAKLYREYGLR